MTNWSLLAFGGAFTTGQTCAKSYCHSFESVSHIALSAASPLFPVSFTHWHCDPSLFRQPMHPSSLFFLILAIFLLQSVSLPCSQALQISFPYFSQQSSQYFDLGTSDVDSSIINTLAIQLTFDSAANSVRIMNNTGRVTYTAEQLKLWDPDFNYSASFNTSFLVNMQRITGDDSIEATTGGGMAFMLSSHTAKESEVVNSYGGWLGLFNQTTVEAPDSPYQLVAVEFDTFKDSFDPDDNHIGIDLTSPVSVKTASLNGSGVFLRTNSTNINSSVWIDYDGRGNQLYVFISSGTNVPKPKKPVLQYGIDLRSHLPENVYLGFTGSTGIQMETHCVMSWNFTSEEFPSPSADTGLIVGVSVVAFVVFFALTVYAVLSHRKRGKSIPQAWRNLNYGPRKFNYKELRKATNNFSADRMLGEGGFGAVYKGTLDDLHNPVVAVKRMSGKSSQGTSEFISEVTIIGRLRHRNLVPLLGWCQDRKGRLLLVYEYMPNGSLNQWLHGARLEKQGTKREAMGWKARYNVMKGLATGLLYLHEEWEMAVVHRDVKPSNVMLDAEYNPRLGDFGLARLIETGSHNAETRNIAGTPAYMAPECFVKGEVTIESDVYSFGIMAMEVATGCRPSFELRFRLWQLHQGNRLSEAAEPHLAGFDPAEMERLLLVGLACCHPDPASRPTIRQVLHALSDVSFPFAVPPLPAHLSIDPIYDMELTVPNVPQSSTRSDTDVSNLGSQNCILGK